jgi:hypothetical protein
MVGDVWVGGWVWVWVGGCLHYAFVGTSTTNRSSVLYAVCLKEWHASVHVIRLGSRVERSLVYDELLSSRVLVG